MTKLFVMALLPTLLANNRYFTQANGQGTELFPGDVVTEDATIYIFADAAANGPCTTESSFTVTVYDTPTVQVDAAAQAVCLGETITPFEASTTNPADVTYNWYNANDTTTIIHQGEDFTYQCRGL